MLFIHIIQRSQRSFYYHMDGTSVREVKTVAPDSCMKGTDSLIMMHDRATMNVARPWLLIALIW
jgi:hypothetical protein